MRYLLIVAVLSVGCSSQPDLTSEQKSFLNQANAIVSIARQTISHQDQPTFSRELPDVVDRLKSLADKLPNVSKDKGWLVQSERIGNIVTFLSLASSNLSRSKNDLLSKEEQSRNMSDAKESLDGAIEACDNFDEFAKSQTGI